MAETLRIVTFAYGGRPVGVKDIHVGGTYERVMDSTEIVPGQKNQVMAKRSRRYGGARQAAESHEPGEFKGTWLITGGTQDQAKANLATLLAELEACARPGRFIEWKMDGATYPEYYEIVAVPAANPKYRWVEFVNAPSMLQAELSFPIAPLAYLPRMDIYDGFGVDSISDYTLDAGAGDLVVFVGALIANANLATEKRAIHTARGHIYLDVQATVKPTPAATITGYKAGVVLNRSAANTYLEVYVDDDGTNSRLRVDKVIAGARTNLQSTNLPARVANGVPFWVRGRREGPLVFAEYFLASNPPTPMVAPSTTPANPVVLSAAEQTALPAGYCGISLIPQAASGVDDFEVAPLTYRNHTLPDILQLATVIPGDAPALVDLEVTPSGGSGAPVFGLFSWAARPSPYDIQWNGDFEDDTNGWQVGAVTGVHAAGSSITRITTASKFGAACGEIVTPATTDTGASFRLFGRFRRGVTYTARIWVQAPASVTQVRVKLGVNGDVAAGANTALTASFAELTVTWTPTADRDEAYLAVSTAAATATTFRVDGARVYQGATAPTLTTQIEGRGALPPFGIIPAESCDTGDLSGWAISADANYRHGQGLKVTASGAGTAAAQWFIDPALMLADEFTLQELDVEIFAKVDLASTLVSPKLTASLRPEAGTNFGVERFTGEWGSAGKLLTKPSSGSAFRTVRLGILTLVCDPDRPVRWKLRIAAAWIAGSSGNFGLDELYAVPVRRRACGPTGKANDSAYPKFVASTSETTKTVRSDLSGLAAKPPANPFPDTGLDAMALLELPPGNVDALVKLASTVPDDPTSNTASEQKEHGATVHLAVWPRINLLRS